jgi:hypothetical protein
MKSRYLRASSPPSFMTGLRLCLWRQAVQQCCRRVPRSLSNPTRPHRWRRPRPHFPRRLTSFADPLYLQRPYFP